MNQCRSHDLQANFPSRVCLLVYAALEYRLRQRLEQAHQSFPNQKGKPIPNPTMRWVFQYFEGIDLLLLPEQPALIANLDEHHQVVIRLLGLTYQRLYS